MFYTAAIRQLHSVWESAVACTSLSSSVVCPHPIHHVSQQSLYHVHRLNATLPNVLDRSNHGYFGRRTAALVLSYPRRPLQFCRPHFEQALPCQNRALRIRSPPELHRSYLDPRRDCMHVSRALRLSEPVQDNTYSGSRAYSLLADRSGILYYIPHQTVRYRRQTAKRCVSRAMGSLPTGCTLENPTIRLVIRSVKW